MPKKLFIIAGEPSGDLHGSRLVETLKALSPGIKICGMGGSLMRKAGVELFYNIECTSVMGFVEVVKKLPQLRKIFTELIRRLDAFRPDAVILVDYPGFNLRFAEEIKKRGLPLIYYISPQLWAWAEHRIKTIKRLVDLMLVLFGFEKAFYERHGVNTVFTGHPLVDSAAASMSKKDARAFFGFSPEKKTVALLPGSRKSEVKKLLPVMLEGAKKISKNLKGAADYFIVKSPILDKGLYERILKNKNAPADIKIIDKSLPDALICADAAVVASGTATLQAALLDIPMVLVYKTSFLTWLLARVLIKIPHIGLVNIVAGKNVVPELIQFRATAGNLSKETLKIIGSPEASARMRHHFKSVREKLGPPGASRRAAQAVLDFIK